MRQFMYSRLKIPKDIIKSEHQRGIYFSTLYDNSREFLRGEIEEKDLKMKQKYIDDSDYIMKWWKPKAIKRYTKLFDEGRLTPEKLFYGDIV